MLEEFNEKFPTEGLSFISKGLIVLQDIIFTGIGSKYKPTIIYKYIKNNKNKKT